MRKAGDDHPGNRRQHPGKKHPGQARHRTQIAIEQRGNQQADAAAAKFEPCSAGRAAMGAWSSEGQNQARKLDSPMQPEAIDSGAVKLTCQT